jgi:F1F0 ATPase subunit 2
MISLLLNTGLAVLIGMALGVFYFGGLWWTVKRLAGARHPVILQLGSLLLRLAFVLLAFYLLLVTLDWERVIVALAGFVVVRLILIHRHRPRLAAVDRRGGVD